MNENKDDYLQYNQRHHVALTSKKLQLEMKVQFENLLPVMKK